MAMVIFTGELNNTDYAVTTGTCQWWDILGKVNTLSKKLMCYKKEKLTNKMM